MAFLISKFATILHVVSNLPTIALGMDVFPELETGEASPEHAVRRHSRWSPDYTRGKKTVVGVEATGKIPTTPGLRLLHGAINYSPHRLSQISLKS